MSKRKSSIKKFSTTSQQNPKVVTQTVTTHNTQTRSSFSRALEWFDDHILLLLSGFLFAFIPLYPKLPLAELIPGYIVRLRLEDVFVAISIVIYGIQVIRKKAEWKTPFTWMILAYAVVGLLSTISGVLITKTIPFELIHIGKSMLHYFRYLEYFSLFFISYSAIKSRRSLSIIFGFFAVTVILITIYGYGQKYYYWPVYSTMNREFSKGLRLYLTEHARVQSTFGGHYDMAGYLVVAIPILLALFFSTNNKKWKLSLFIAYTFGVWLLIMSASRTSFVGFVFELGLLLGLLALQQQGWRNKITWGVTRSFFVFAMLSYMYVVYGESIAGRFYQTLEGYPTLLTIFQNIDDTRHKIFSGEFSALLERYNLKLPEAKLPENAISTDDAENQVLTPTDERPTSTRPSDVYVDVPDKVTITTVSAEGVASTSTIEVPRTFSDNAFKYGLSMSIRLDTLWPRAIAGFYKNPLLGSGYATLTKSAVGEFTEAESTDNNFLRTLGETGLLGFFTFYGVVVIGIYFATMVTIKSKSYYAKAVAIGFISATIGLLINAIFIDIFASSKVAFTYWGLSGFLIAFFVKELKYIKTTPQLPDEKVATVVLPKPKQ